MFTPRAFIRLSTTRTTTLPKANLQFPIRSASVLAPKFTDRDALSVWRHPASRLKMQEKLDMDVFEKKRRHAVYQYAGPHAPHSGQIKSTEEYVLGLGPYHMAAYNQELARLARAQNNGKLVGRLEGLERKLNSIDCKSLSSSVVVERNEGVDDVVNAATVAVAALVGGGSGMVYFYFA